MKLNSKCLTDKFFVMAFFCLPIAQSFPCKIEIPTFPFYTKFPHWLFPLGRLQYCTVYLSVTATTVASQKPDYLYVHAYVYTHTMLL